MQPKILILASAILLAFGIFAFVFFTEDPDSENPAVKALLEQLEEQGYVVGTIEVTILGRYRIEAHSDKFEREIVFAPGAGTFLRDDTLPLTEGDADGDD